jgi:hypothetical protein
MTAVAVLAIAALALAGCGGSDEGSETTATETTATETMRSALVNDERDDHRRLTRSPRRAQLAERQG